MRNIILFISLIVVINPIYSQNFHGVNVPQDFFEIPVSDKLWFLLSRNQPELVLSIMDTLKIEDEDIYFPMYKARANYELKRYEEAEIILDNYLSAPDTITKSGWDATSLCLSYKGLVRLQQNDTINAIIYLKKGVDYAPDRYDFEFASFELAKLNNDYGTSKIIKKMKIDFEAPEFKLEDELGRIYELRDFQGKPVVLHIGTTWCGSCQQDAKALEEFANKYSENCYFIKILSGENPISGIDYKNHYNSCLLTLYDYSGTLLKDYKTNALASTILIDTNNIVQFNESDIFYDENYQLLFKSALKKVLNVNTLNEKKTNYVCDKTKCYLPYNKTKKVKLNQYYPEFDIDSKGNIWITYVSNESGNNNIYLRKYKKDKIIAEFKITQNIKNNYFPDIVIDSEDIIYILWISNQFGAYNVLLKQLNGNIISEEMQITDNNNDIFHPQLAVDGQDNLHLVYYRWDTIDGFSRDRNVFYKYFDKSQWSDEIEVNPEHPRIDDHTDPHIAINSRNEISVIWSYDYHRNEYKQPVNSYSTSIFHQLFEFNKKKGDCVFIGSTEIDPSYITDIYPVNSIDNDDNFWFAWQAMENQSMKIMCKKDGSRQEFLLSNPNYIAITPDIQCTKDGKIVVVWSQKDETKWNIYKSVYKNGIWTNPENMTPNYKDSKEPKLVLKDKKNSFLLFTEYNNGQSNIRLKKIEI